METNSKLNTLGKQVLNAVKEGCKCWSDIEINCYDCTDSYAGFRVKGGIFMSSPVYTKVYSICNAFELVDKNVSVCCSMNAAVEDGTAYPYLHISVSFKK